MSLIMCIFWQETCHQYWPSSTGEVVEFEEYFIKCKSVQTESGYVQTVLHTFTKQVYKATHIARPHYTLES